MQSSPVDRVPMYGTPIDEWVNDDEYPDLTIKEYRMRIRRNFTVLVHMLNPYCGLIDGLLENGYVKRRWWNFDERRYRKYIDDPDRSKVNIAILNDLIGKYRKKIILFLIVLDTTGQSHVRRYICHDGNRFSVATEHYRDWPLTKEQINEFNSCRPATVELLAKSYIKVKFWKEMILILEQWNVKDTRLLYEKIMDEMVKLGKLTNRERQHIIETSSWSYDGARNFLDIIAYKSISSIQTFIHCLNKYGNEYEMFPIYYYT